MRNETGKLNVLENAAFWQGWVASATLIAGLGLIMTPSWWGAVLVVALMMITLVASRRRYMASGQFRQAVARNVKTLVATMVELETQKQK